MYLMSNDRLCSTMFFWFFFRCDACCFDDLKKRRSHPAAVLCNKTSPSFARICFEWCENVVERLPGVFVSFILNGAERLRHASTC